MNKYVSLDKRSKKAQREYHTKQRCTWGELNPVTRSVPSGKTYNRKKEKQRIGKEFRNGFDADLFFFFVKENMKKHDPKAPFLIGNSQPGDVIHEAEQKSWIDLQMRLEI